MVVSPPTRPSLRPPARLLAATLLVAAALARPEPATAQLASLGSVLLDQCDGTPDLCEANDELGHAVAAGDFNGDGFEDLAVSAPYESVGAVARAGAVRVLYGSRGRLRASGDQFFSQSTSGVAGVVEENDFWGISLAAGRFNTDTYDDLAIGGPYEDLTVGGVEHPDAGAVWVLFGSASGLTSAGSLSFDQETAPTSRTSPRACSGSRPTTTSSAWR